MDGNGGNRVVIVGGGIAGGYLAKSIQFNASVTLIDPKEYFEIPWTSSRSKVEPEFAKRTLIKHTDYLTNGKVIISSAINVTQNEVLTADGHAVAYDYLVIATGHPNSSPTHEKERLDQFQNDNEKIKSAGSILIVGGGRTGVELAGEISVDYPKKKITLVHNGSRLLELVGLKASKKALNWLTSNNVDVLLDQAVDFDAVDNENKAYTTTAGKQITADCHFDCTEKPLGSSWLYDTFLKGCIDKDGSLMLDQNLRVKDNKNIFAIGDITNVLEVKQGYLAQMQAEVVAKNLKLLVNGANESKLVKYKFGQAVVVVSLGRKSGVAQLPFMTMAGRLPAMFKSKDLFVGWTRKMMGLNRKI